MRTHATALVAGGWPAACPALHVHSAAHPHGPRMPCRLEEVGYGVGVRLLEVLCFRERGSRREVRLLDVLKFIHSTLWKYMFGRQARDLEQSNTVGAERAEVGAGTGTAGGMRGAALRSWNLALLFATAWN